MGSHLLSCYPSVCRYDGWFLCPAPPPVPPFQGLPSDGMYSPPQNPPVVGEESNSPKRPISHPLEPEVMIPYVVCHSTQVAITKHQVGQLKHRDLFSHSSGGWKFKVKVDTGLLFPGNLSVGVQMVHSDHTVTGSSLCGCTRLVSPYALISFYSPLSD